MTATIAAPTTTAPAPMPAEMADAHLDAIESALADLELAVGRLAAASWGAASDATTSRHLPDGTVQPIADWIARIQSKLTEVCEASSVCEPG